MMKILIPLILTLVGLGAGVGAGMFLGPGDGEDPHGEEQAAKGSDHGKDSDKHASKEEGKYGSNSEDVEFARMNNQFVVPIIDGEIIDAMVVLSITLEVEPGGTETVFRQEPRLRDRFLRVLFDHANIGGFGPGFTQSGTMSILRTALRETANDTLGELVRDVLIVDIVRQDV